MPKIKNILIFVAIAAVFVLIYIFFIKPKPPVANLVSSTSSAVTLPTPGVTSSDPKVAQDFLNLLLNVKNIKLDDSIFAEKAFQSLHDSSIVLVQDGKEGRINPFAPIGSDEAEPPAIVEEEETTPPASSNPPLTCPPPKVLNAARTACINSILPN